MERNDNTTQKDYYKILEVDYDATDEKIRLNYRKLALKWHPDKHNGNGAVTAKFQEINEAYTVLSDPDKRLEYDFTGIYEIDKYTLREYLARFKGMILTCNGLGISHTSTWFTGTSRSWNIEMLKSLYHITGAAGDGADRFVKYFINKLQTRIRKLKNVNDADAKPTA